MNYNDIEFLFAIARLNPVWLKLHSGRLQGKHCVARLKRAQARRQKLPRGYGRLVARTPYTP